MRKIKLVLVLFLTIFSLGLIACGEGGNTEIDWSKKTVSGISPVKETFYAKYEYDEFEIGMLKIRVEYTDGTSREIPVSEDMLDEKDVRKLKSVGKPRITIYYDAFDLQMTVNLIDSSRLDENLNADGKYACVIKAIRDQEAGIINFIFEGNENYNVCSMSFAYSYDNSLMQLSNAKMNEALTGIGDVQVVDGKVMFAYTESGTALEGEIILFTVNYTGDFRNSNLAAAEDFNNVVYLANFTDFSTTLADNVLYHASIK